MKNTINKISKFLDDLSIKYTISEMDEFHSEFGHHTKDITTIKLKNYSAINTIILLEVDDEIHVSFESTITKLFSCIDIVEFYVKFLYYHENYKDKINNTIPKDLKVEMLNKFKEDFTVEIRKYKLRMLEE